MMGFDLIPTLAGEGPKRRWLSRVGRDETVPSDRRDCGSGLDNLRSPRVAFDLP
jgi:hypothetical protein